MSLKSSLRPFTTVKFKIALWYAVLFLLASTATFFSVYWTLSSIMTGKEDKALLDFSREMELRFLRGDNVNDDGEWLKLEKVPKSVAETIKQATVAGVKIREAKKTVKDGKTVYEAVGFLDGLLYRIKVSDNGELLSMETEPLQQRIQRLEDDFSSESYSEGLSKVYFLLLSPKGEILAKSDLRKWPELKESATRKIPKLDRGSLFRTENLRRHHREARVLDRALPDGNILEVGQSTLEREKVLTSYLSISLSILGGMTIAGSLAGWLIARRFMAGVDRVRNAAENIAKGDFSQRVALGGEGYEIDRLGCAFNDMIAKIQGLIAELKGVSDNIAHDLRTPITRIRGVTEVALTGEPSIEEMKDLAGDTVEECDRLLIMINTMLEITQAESGLLTLRKEEVDLKELLAAAHELLLPLAEDKQIAFEMKTPQEKLLVSGDKIRLQRVVANLLDNAIKYTPSKGKVELSAACANHKVQITVKDSGCGIPEKERQRIFERFYRCDSSRSMTGNGLGLSLVQAIVKAHNGEITVKSVEGEGSEFIVTIPTVN